VEQHHEQHPSPGPCAFFGVPGMFHSSGVKIPFHKPAPAIASGDLPHDLAVDRKFVSRIDE